MGSCENNNLPIVKRRDVSHGRTDTMLSSTLAVQPASADEAALPQLKALLGQIMRITTTDGRVFIGTLAGTDKPLNVILINAEEYRISKPQAKPGGRHVGQVIFPWKIVAKIEAHMQQEVREQQIHDDWYLW